MAIDRLMKTVLVPVSESEEEAVRVERTVLDCPFNREEVRCVVLNVFEEFKVKSAEWSAIDSADFYDEQFPKVAATVASNFAEAGFTVDVRREHGKLAETILAVADEVDASAIVIAGRKRSPVGKALFGSVTQEVLLSANIPVVVGPRTTIE